MEAQFSSLLPKGQRALGRREEGLTSVTMRMATMLSRSSELVRRMTACPKTAWTSQSCWAMALSGRRGRHGSREGSTLGWGDPLLPTDLIHSGRRPRWLHLKGRRGPHQGCSLRSGPFRARCLPGQEGHPLCVGFQVLKELPGLLQLEAGEHLPVVGRPEESLQGLQACPRGKWGVQRS